MQTPRQSLKSPDLTSMESSRSSKPSLEGLSSEEQAEAAFAKILRCANARETSTLKMREKLLHAGFPPNITEGALERAASAGIIDDARYCDCLIRSALSQGKGLHFVLKEAASLGIVPEELESYQQHLEEDADGMVDRALGVLRRRRPASKDIQAASYRRLMAKGYGHTVAAEAARLFREECEAESAPVQ